MPSNAALLSRYLTLKSPSEDEKIQVTYIWIDGKQGLRSKTRTVNFVPTSAEELPIWNYDGSSTYQSTGSNSDVYLKPIRLYRDPFRLHPNKLVLCETVTEDGQPTSTNTRAEALRVMEQATKEEPWFGIEQEYFLFEPTGDRPRGWPSGSTLDMNEVYAFAHGPGHVVNRDLVNIHFAACLYAGVQMAGLNSEGILGQWEYQVGPCKGITIGDDLWMSRYILHRVAEDYNIGVTYHPMPFPGLFLGTGGHTNFSTKAMRQEGGLEEIYSAISKLEGNHFAHIAKYDQDGGQENKARLVKGPCNEDWNVFSSGIGNRGASIRIPLQVSLDGAGYLEDRRPAGNLDPYVVAEMLVRTVCLNEKM